jgi:hypothetical protein
LKFRASIQSLHAEIVGRRAWGRQLICSIVQGWCWTCWVGGRSRTQYACEINGIEFCALRTHTHTHTHHGRGTHVLCVRDRLVCLVDAVDSNGSWAVEEPANPTGQSTITHATVAPSAASPPPLSQNTGFQNCLSDVTSTAASNSRRLLSLQPSSPHHDALAIVPLHATARKASLAHLHLLLLNSSCSLHAPLGFCCIHDDGIMTVCNCPRGSQPASTGQTAQPAYSNTRWPHAHCKVRLVCARLKSTDCRHTLLVVCVLCCTWMQSLFTFVQASHHPVVHSLRPSTDPRSPAA